MDLLESGLIGDIPNGISYGQNERIDELNWRIQERMTSTHPMKPNYDPRPVMTKYSLFPLIDRVKEMEEPKKTYQDFDVESNFYPMTDRPHCSGYFNNIDRETNMRNQNCILQKYETKNAYEPNFNSDLYKIKPPEFKQPLDTTNMHPALFEQQTFKGNTYDFTIGRMKFNNPTRTQLRNNM